MTTLGMNITVEPIILYNHLATLDISTTTIENYHIILLFRKILKKCNVMKTKLYKFEIKFRNITRKTFFSILIKNILNKT